MADNFKPLFSAPVYKYILKRMDDNGHEFEIKKFEFYSLAKKEKELYESRGHKQTYFIVEAK